MRTLLLIVLLPSVLAALCGTACGDVALIELTPDALKDPKVQSVMSVGVNAVPDQAGVFSVFITGPVDPKVTVSASLLIGTEKQIRVETYIRVSERTKKGQGRDGQKMWSCTLRLDRASATDAVITVMRDSGPSGDAYRIPLKPFLPAEK